MKKFNFITLILFPGRIFCAHVGTIMDIAAAIFGRTTPEAVQSIKTIILKIKLRFGDLKSQGFEHYIVQLFHMEQYRNQMVHVKNPSKNSGINLLIMAKT